MVKSTRDENLGCFLDYKSCITQQLCRLGFRYCAWNRTKNILRMFEEFLDRYLGELILDIKSDFTFENS